MREINIAKSVYENVLVVKKMKELHLRRISQGLTKSCTSLRLIRL